MFKSVKCSGKGEGNEKGRGWENSKLLRCGEGGGIMFTLEIGNGYGRP